MFWKFDLHPNSSLDTILSKEVEISMLLFTIFLTRLHPAFNFPKFPQKWTSKISCFGIRHCCLSNQAFSLSSRIVHCLRFWTKTMYYRNASHKIESSLTCKCLVWDVGCVYKNVCYALSSRGGVLKSEGVCHLGISISVVLYCNKPTLWSDFWKHQSYYLIYNCCLCNFWDIQRYIYRDITLATMQISSKMYDLLRCLSD